MSFFHDLRQGALAWLLMASAAQAAGPLVLTTGAEQPWSTPDGKGFLNLLVRDAAARLGLQAEVQQFTSSERALVNADRGVDDGVAMRIAGLEKMYPSLVRVAEPIAVNDFVAFVRGAPLAAAEWASLKGRTVGYVNGWKIFELNVPRGTEATVSRDADQLFALFAGGRVEVALYERWQGVFKIRLHGLDVQPFEPPLARVPMHIYLHRRHEALAARVSDAVAAMKRDGAYARHWEAAVGALQRMGH